jgi:hypothetical protein
MLVSIMYLFGMVFMGGAHEHMKEHPESDSVSKDLKVWYGTLAVTLRTLFRVISGGADWFDASEMLFKVSVGYGLLYIVYIFLMVFGVLNVLVGVFVDSAMATACMDAEILAVEAERERMALFAHAEKVLESVDEDGSGTVTWEEFEANLENPAVQKFLEAMEIDKKEMEDVFAMVDDDDSGFVNIEEFMEGCMKLKSGANLSTIVMLLYEVKTLLQKQERRLGELQEFELKIGRGLSGLQAQSDRVHHRLCGPHVDVGTKKSAE